MSRKTRKLIWSVPLVATLAIVGALAAFIALTPNDASAQNVAVAPGQPINLQAAAYAEGIPEEEIELTWDAPTDGGSPRQYRIDISENGGFTWVALKSDVRGTRHLDEGLKASQTRHYRVFALNQHGISSVSDTISAATADSTVPNRPTGLNAKVGPDTGTPGEATTDAELTITLTWSNPINPPGAKVSGYTVEYSVDGSIWDPVPGVKKSSDKHVNLDAAVTYQYRVAAVNSVGQSGWSSTASANTLRGAMPDAPEDLRSAVTPTELNVWLYWAPPADPKGDPVTGYEVQGKPIAVGGPRLTGGSTATLAQLAAITDGPDTDDGSAGDTDTDDNEGSITVAGIHFNDIDLADIDSDGLPISAVAPDGFDFLDVAARLETALQQEIIVVGSQVWANDAPFVHPITVNYSDMYYSSLRSSNAAAEEDRTEPDPRYWTEVDTSDWNMGTASVEFTGLRFVLTIPSTTMASELAKALPHPKSEKGNLATLLGWTSAKGAVSEKQYACCMVADGMGFQTVKTDISKPSGEDINQFLVTLGDVGNTTYSSRFIANTDWEFRIRALNRRVPADAPNAGLTTTGVPVALDWSDPIPATPGSDTAQKRAEGLTVTRSEMHHEGRTGLILTWNKATTVRNADGGSDDALAYRIEYSNTGLRDEGYDWKVLTELHNPADDGDPSTNVDDDRQTFIDHADILDGEANDLAAGQTREYRVFARNSVTVADAEMSWPSPQNSGRTADPLRPEPPKSLRTTPGGHTSIELEWNAPDASNDELDGSEEGPSVITHYVIQSSDNEGVTWQELDGTVMGTVYEDTDLAPGQTRDYRVAAVNSRRGGQSVWSNTADETTIPAVLPNEPGGLVAEAYGQNAIKLCWNTQAEQPEDAPVTAYLIEYSADGEAGWAELGTVTDMTDDDVHTIYTDQHALNGGDTRHYRVFAINLRGQSDQSDVANATTGPATIPDAPVATATADSDTEITVTWTAPADGGSDITGYMVQRAYMGDADMMTEWMDVDPAHTGMDMEYMDTGLMPETTYYYQVRAMNAAGNGEWSDGMASAMTMTMTMTMGTELTAPSGVVVSSLRDTVSVTWDPASIENADQVKVVLFDSGVTKIVYLETFNAANDPDAATFRDVDSGTYKVTVASFRTGDRHKLSALMEVTVE